MEFKWSLMCLIALLLNLVVAEIQEATADTDSTEEAEESTTVSSLQVPYQMPQPIGEVFFSETFDDGTMDGWVLSRAMKEDTDEEIGKYDGIWEIEELKKNQIPGDKGLVLKSAARHHAIAAMLSKPFIFDDQPLIVQYEVNFQDGIDCGGAYIKLLSHTENLDLEQFFDKTSYTIMFGPDKCGEDYKLHFIFRHKNPKTGDFEEKHAKHTETSLKAHFTDKKTHLYTLVLNLDDTFEIFVDQTSVSKGHLLEDMTPPVNPPEEIEDPDDIKPEEWDERLRIPDPSAAKPDDWNEDEPETIEDADAVKPEGWLDDEPEYIPDPTAEKPLDWDEEVDAEWEAALVPNPKCESAPGCGEWTRPVIPNPNYKGIWTPPMIENPNYQGIWSPRKILNPYYFVDLHPFMMTSFSAIGLELWSMTPDIYFDNFIICSEKEVADQWAADTWGLKRLVASANEPGIFSQLLMAANENPWLWTVYSGATVPVGFLVYFFWPGKKKDEANIDSEETQPVTKGALEAPENEDTQEKGEDVQNNKGQNAGKGALEKECGGKRKSKQKKKKEQQDGNKSNKSALDDELEEDYGITMSENGPILLRKRNIPKDELSSPEVVFTSHVL
ncbi:calmegin [Ambystoma mexicanum]|uniref:calmegin n=1 Tax=Ambystoma mexicanum TaxID=8296 RepID=UPI0037E91D3F